MNVSDGAVDEELMRAAASTVAAFDTDAAIAWMREREDTLAIFIKRQAARVLNELRECQGALLTDANASAIERAVIVTALTAVAALMTGHYQLWRDLVRETPMAGIDPLLGIRKRNDPRQSPLQAAVQLKQHLKTGTAAMSTPGVGDAASDEALRATPFKFAGCRSAQDSEGVAGALIAIAAERPGDALQLFALTQADAEQLHGELTDVLARLRSPRALAAWTSVCANDPKFAPLDADAGPAGPKKLRRRLN